MATASHPTLERPTAADAGPVHPDSAPPPGGRVARLIVVLCFAITIVATALIYWRWANVAEPSSYVIVEGAEEHNGTVVTVSTDHGNDVVAMATLSPDNDYGVTIFLNPGNYWFTAVHHGTPLIEGDLLVAHRRFKTIVLRKRNEPAGDASRAAGVP